MRTSPLLLAVAVLLPSTVRSQQSAAIPEDVRASVSAVSVDDLGYHLLDSTMALSPARAAVGIAADSLEPYVGRYQLTPAFIITVSREGTALYLQATGQSRFPLFASARNEFFLRDVEAQISFERDSLNRVQALVLHQNGANQRAGRIP